MKKKEFLTEAKRKAIIADKEKAILESFAKTFNKIKRVDENEIKENWEEEEKKKQLQQTISQTNGSPVSDEEMSNVMSAMQMQKENEMSEAVTAEDKLNELIGKPISLIRTLHTRGKYNPETGEMPKVTEDKQIDGVIGEIVDEFGLKGLKVMNSQGGKIAFLMYDKHSGSFIEGDSTFRYTYKGADETSERILQFILRYLVGIVNENEIKENENINTLANILQNKGSLDHLKNNDRIRLKLIDGEFLKKNPEWEDRSLKFLFYDSRSNMVGVELIGTGKSGNAYPKELVIDLGQTNINEFEEENPLYSRQQEFGINPYQEQPELSDLGQLTPDQEEMKNYISKYVNSELELNHEMSNYINNGYQGLSDSVKQGLYNDMDYQTWVQIQHDEDTFRRERGF